MRALLVILTAAIVTVASKHNAYKYEGYYIGNMQVQTVTPSNGKYSKTLVFCHGAGGNSQHYVDKFQNAEFGHPTGIRFVFPSSPLTQSGRTPWFKVHSSHSRDEDGRWDMDDLDASADKILAVVRQER